MVLVGNIGLGKSTFAKKHIEHGYTVSSYDTIASGLMAGIGGISQGAKFAKAVKSLYEYTIYEMLSRGISVIADDLNLRISERKYLYKIAKGFGAQIIVVDFGPGTEEGLNRRAGISNSFDFQGFDIMYQDLKNRYQRPGSAEGFDIVINKE